jgi:hypothetical protein
LVAHEEDGRLIDILGHNAVDLLGQQARRCETQVVAERRGAHGECPCYNGESVRTNLN